MTTSSANSLVRTVAVPLVHMSTRWLSGFQNTSVLAVTPIWTRQATAATPMVSYDSCRAAFAELKSFFVNFPVRM